MAVKAAAYSFFAYWGRFWPKMRRPERRKKAFVALTASMLGVMACVSLGSGLDMQANKFPPNMAFIFFGSASLSLLTLAFRPILGAVSFCRKSKAFNWLFQRFERNSRWIFLFHAFVTAGVRLGIMAFQWLGLIGGSIPLWTFPFALCIMIAGSAVCGFVFEAIERRLKSV